MKRHCFTLVPFFALIGLLLSPLAAHTSSSSTGQSSEPISTFYVSDGSITSVAFSPDGRLLALEGLYDSSEFKLWDVSAGQSIATFSRRGTGWWTGTLSSDGQRLAGWTEDGTIELWDVSRGGQHVATISAHETGVHGAVSMVSFSPDGQLLASGGASDTLVKLWDVSRGGQQVATFPLHDSLGLVVGLAFSPDGRLLASYGQFGPVILWDVSRGGQQVATFPMPHERNGLAGARSSLFFSPDGRQLASGGQRWNVKEEATSEATSEVKLLDVSTGQSIATLAGNYPVSFSPNGRLLASVSQDTSRWFLDDKGEQDQTHSRGKDIKLWDVSTGQSIATLPLSDDLKELNQAAQTLVFSPDGRLLASQHDSGVQLWDVSEWMPMPHALTRASGEGQRGQVGTALAAPFVVSVLDEYGSALAGVVVSFSVTAGGGTLASSTDTTDVNGQARSTLTLGSVLGTNMVTATVGGLEPITFTATAVDQTPQTLTKVSGDNQAGPASTQLAAPFVVSVLDQDGEAFAGASVTFSVTAGDGMLLSAADTNSCAVGSSTSSTTVLTDANGQAATRLTLGSESGTNTVTATMAGIEPVTFTATAAEQAMPHSLTKVCGDDQEGEVETLLAAPFVVSVVDEDGAAMAGVVVSFSVTAGGGTLSDTTATTNANGRARTWLTLGSESGTNTVEATVAGLEPVTFTATGQKSALASLFDAFLGGGKLVALPESTQLLQNAPNPFNSQTVLSYFLHAPGPARVEVFTLTGQRVAFLQQGPQQAGYHRLRWDGRDDAGHLVASGMYLYRLGTDETVLTRKLILLR